MPSKHIRIRRIVAFSRASAGISFGSEMSGGISNIKVSFSRHCFHNCLSLSVFLLFFGFVFRLGFKD